MIFRYNFILKFTLSLRVALILCYLCSFLRSPLGPVRGVPAGRRRRGRFGARRRAARSLASAPSLSWPVDAFPSVSGLVRPVPLVSGAWWVPVYSKRLIRASSLPQKQVEASHKSVLARSMAMMRKLVVNPVDTPAPHKPHVGNKHAYARMQVCLTVRVTLCDSKTSLCIYEISTLIMI